MGGRQAESSAAQVAESPPSGALTTWRTRLQGVAPWAPDWLWILASYVAVFAVLAGRLLPSFARALPRDPNLDDAYGFAWVLAWVAHALAVDPAGVFDANVSHPALRQLTGLDHLFGAQVLFGPLYALTGQVVLATNLLGFLTYPLGALAMERLLRALDMPALIAWVIGFAFALGALRVPFNLNLLQYTNLFYPWVALALIRLREQPDAKHAALLFLAFALGMFTSFYTTVLLGLAAAIWGIFELARPIPGRGRFVAWSLGVAAVSVGALLAAVQPYFIRLESQNTLMRFALPLRSVEEYATAVVMVLGLMAQSVGLTLRPLFEVGLLLAGVAIAVLAWQARLPVARRIVPRALVLWLFGAAFSFGFPEWLAPMAEVTPLSFVRYVYRYVVIGDFGLLLLVAVALAWARARLGTRARAAIPLAFALVVVIGRGIPFALTRMHVAPAITTSAPAYDAVAEILRAEGGGPLLELPLVGALPGFPLPRPYTLETDAMLASTLHWWRTPTAHTSYHAPHRWFFMNTVAALPAHWALDDLIDLTHVRWLLLKPDHFWMPASQREATEQFLLSSPAVGKSWRLPEGWLLLRLDRVPQHHTWFETARSGDVRGKTVLGNPLAPLQEADAIGEVQLDATRQAPTVSNARLGLTVLLRNLGRVPWPASPPSIRPLTLDGRWGNPLPIKHCVVLMARWWRLAPDDGSDRQLATTQQLRLRRDVDPGEEIRQMVGVLLPEQDGTYDLELRIEQVDGARFQEAGNQPYEARVHVAGGMARLEEPPR